jgi:hypothetical protein
VLLQSDHFALVRLFMTKPCLHALAPLQPCYKAYTRVAHASNNINAGAGCECGWADIHNPRKPTTRSAFCQSLQLWSLRVGTWDCSEPPGGSERQWVWGRANGEFFARRRPTGTPACPPPPASCKSEERRRVPVGRLRCWLFRLLPLPTSAHHALPGVCRSGCCAGPQHGPLSAWWCRAECGFAQDFCCLFVSLRRSC